MAKEEFFNNGSRWLRADFHLHTKSDTEFKRFTGTDSEFTSQYVAQLKRQGIGIGVVTNHNKFNREEFCALKKAADAENIYLLPGVEFSLRDGSRGIHLLIIRCGNASATPSARRSSIPRRTPSRRSPS